MEPSVGGPFAEAKTLIRETLRGLQRESVEFEKLRKAAADAGSKREADQLKAIERLQNEVAQLKQARADNDAALAEVKLQNSTESDSKVETAITLRTSAIFDAVLQKDYLRRGFRSFTTPISSGADS
jgi:hypothetical protein